MNWQLWTGLALVFLVVFLTVVLLVQYRLQLWEKEVELKRFMALVGIGRKVSSDVQNAKSCQWCKWVEILFPIRPEERKRLNLLLSQAGFPDADAIPRFLLGKLLFIFAGLLLGGVLVMRGSPFFILLVIAAAGAILPERFLAWLANKRRQRIDLALPDFLDMVSIAMRAGLNWMASLQRVVAEFKEIEPALADVFEQMLNQIQLGMPRERALKQLAERSGSEDIAQLAQMLIENERLGAPIAPSLETFTQRLYTRREQKLEEKAAKLSAKMSIVILVFMMIPYLIILLGERFVSLSRSF